MKRHLTPVSGPSTVGTDTAAAPTREEPVRPRTDPARVRLEQKLRTAEAVVRELDLKRSEALRRADVAGEQVDALGAELEAASSGDLDQRVQDLDRLQQRAEAAGEDRHRHAARAEILDAQIDQAGATVEIARADLDEYDDQRARLAAMTSTAAGADAGQDDPDQDAVVLRFASLPLFVEGYVLPNWRHKRPKEINWCRSWWLHSEAIVRLTVLWEAFEAMRLEPPPSLSVLWRDHIDVHMAALTSDSGTFAQCDPVAGTHRPQPMWPAAAAPAGLFKQSENAHFTTLPGQQEQAQ